MLRVINTIMKTAVRLGIAPPGTYLLTVQGRKTGKAYSTPVSLVEDGGKRWLVSPYGEPGWLKNARAAGQVSLRRGGKSETMSITELSPEESAPILKRYIHKEKITQPYFDVSPDAPLEAFIAEAPRHPVFLLGSLTA